MSRRNLAGWMGTLVAALAYLFLAVPMASAQIEKLDDVHDVQVVLTYEQANKNRASVVRSAQTRTEELTQEFSDANS